MGNKQRAYRIIDIVKELGLTAVFQNGLALYALDRKMLEALIPNSRLEVFEQGGHLFMLTHREQTISSLRGFLDGPDREDRKAA